MPCPYYRKGTMEYCIIYPKGIARHEIVEKELCSTENYRNCLIYRCDSLGQSRRLDKALREFNTANRKRYH